MKVVGHSARLHRGPTGTDLYVHDQLGDARRRRIGRTSSSTPPALRRGTYLLYTTNLNYLSNDTQDFGGMMTEIRIQ